MPSSYHHPAALADEDLLKHCTLARGRAGGPGGQNRNKVETLVEITHTPSGICAHAGERRSQIENKHVALKRLRLNLAVELRTVPPKPRGLAAMDASWGSDLWRSRVLKGGRIACNPNHHDYPSLLAEALDHIADEGWDHRPAAEHLGVTPTQLLKLVKDHGPAMAMWNGERERRGLRGLK